MLERQHLCGKRLINSAQRREKHTRHRGESVKNVSRSCFQGQVWAVCVLGVINKLHGRLRSQNIYVHVGIKVNLLKQMLKISTYEQKSVITRCQLDF